MFRRSKSCGNFFGKSKKNYEYSVIIKKTFAIGLEKKRIILYNRIEILYIQSERKNYNGRKRIITVASGKKR